MDNKTGCSVLYYLQQSNNCSYGINAEDNNGKSGIKCAGSFSTDCECILNLQGFKYGIECEEFIAQNSDDSQLTINIQSEDSGIVCNQFTLCTSGRCMLEIETDENGAWTGERIAQ